MKRGRFGRSADYWRAEGALARAAIKTTVTNAIAVRMWIALEFAFCLTCPVAALFIPHGLAYKAHPDLDDRAGCPAGFADRIFHVRLTLK